MTEEFQDDSRGGAVGNMNEARLESFYASILLCVLLVLKDQVLVVVFFTSYWFMRVDYLKVTFPLLWKRSSR